MQPEPRLNTPWWDHSPLRPCCDAEAAQLEAAGVSGEPGARSVRPARSPWSSDLGDFFQEVHHVDRSAGLILADTRTNTNQAAIMRRC